MSFNDLSVIRDGFSTQLRQQINEGVERLLEQWMTPHSSHSVDVRKVFDEHTGPMRERFDCVRCNETLILKHEQTMVGTEIHWTVTPEVWKVGGNPDRNPDILSGSECGKGEEGVSGQESGQTTEQELRNDLLEAITRHEECNEPDAERDGRGCYRDQTWCDFYDEVQGLVADETLAWSPEADFRTSTAMKPPLPLVGSPTPAEPIIGRITYGGTIRVEVSDEASAEYAATQLERIAGEIRRGAWRPDYVDEVAPDYVGALTPITPEEMDDRLRRAKGRKRWMGE